MTPEQYIHKIIELSAKKLDGLRQILNLSEKQSSVITEDNIEELQETINLKQCQMDIIDEVDSAFEVYYSRLKSVLGVQSIEEIKITQFQEAAELKNIVTEIFDITKQIQRLENDNSKKVRNIINKLGNDIRQVNQSKITNNGYNVGGRMPQQSYFFDKKK